MSIKYLAGRTFDVGTDTVEPGDELSEEQVAKIPYLDSFISSGYIYVVTPAKGYDQLPPHVFNAVQTRPEALRDIKAGEEGTFTTQQADDAQKAVDTDEQSELAQRQKEQDDRFAAARQSRRHGITKQEKENAVSIEDGKTEIKVVKGDPAPGFIEHSDGLEDRAPAEETEEKLKEHTEDRDVTDPREETKDSDGGKDDGKATENEVDGDKGDFDPTNHTVDEVKEYLEKHPEDKDRVLKAEADGKNRSTIAEL